MAPGRLVRWGLVRRASAPLPTLCAAPQHGGGPAAKNGRRLTTAWSMPQPRRGLATIFSPTPEHEALRSMARSFVEKEVEPQAREHSRTESLNLPLLRRLGELGLMGVTVPEEYGGSGMDATAAVIVHEELAASDPGLGLSFLAHSMLFVNNLAVNGSHEQKQRILPGAVAGRIIGGMCMSEPGTGTDVLGMKSGAVQQSDGSWLLSGTKLWITNGTLDGREVGDAFLVYARSGPTPRDLTLFLVEKGERGFSLGQQLKDKLGMRASPTAELVFEACRLPASALVGEKDGAMLCMMRNLEIERVTLAAMGLGIARRCIEEMNRYAKQRKAFGSSLNRFGQIQRLIAESFVEYQAGRSYVYQTASGLRLDSAGNGLDADGVKLYCAAMAKTAADRAIQVLGGYGYVGEYNVERLWRDAKLLEIGGGTNEAHHKNIVRDLVKSVDKLP